MAKENKEVVKLSPGEIIQKIMDILTIIFPAIVAVIGVLNLPNGEEIIGKVEMIKRILVIVLSAAASIASIIYNQVKSFREKTE